MYIHVSLAHFGCLNPISRIWQICNLAEAFMQIFNKNKHAI